MNTWSKTITLYNRHEDAQTGEIAWYRHIIRHCFIKNGRTAVYGSNSVKSESKNVLRIPKQKNYMSPDQWLSFADKTNRLTLQLGDIIIFGEVSDTVDEYTQGKRSSDLISKYNYLGAMMIEYILINTAMAKPHYHVEG